MLDGSVSVAAGATLTIQPGVVVKLNGAFRTLNVNGTVNAVGTSANRITFTSIQDDSIGGDCGGDGPTTGAPGQWYYIGVESGNANSTFDYVDVRYGGNGSSNIQYGALRASGTSTSITVDHANITDNQRAGILLGNGCASCPSGVTIKNSLLARNGAGISAVNGWAIVGAGNTIRDNAGNGLFFNLTSGYTGLRSTVTRSDIAQNGGSGVQLNVESGLPTASWPSGNRNNIYANAANGIQIGTLSRNRAVDWTGNFWGTDVRFQYNQAICQFESLGARGILAHADGSRVIPGGFYLAGNPVNPSWCYFDDIKIEPWEFSPTYLDGAGDLPPSQILGGGVGLHAINPAGFNAEPVNTATGNYYTSATDLRLPGIGVPFAFTRSYNSLDAASGPLGPGWTHSYAAGLTIKPSGDVVFRAEDGQQVEYTRQGDGTFVGTAGTLSTLTQVTGGYELLRRDQVRYRFDTSGLLTSIRDRNGQGLSFAYSGGKLSTVTDSVGRVITLFYNTDGLLSQVALPDGRSVSYGYTGGQLTSVTDARNGVTNYTYEAYGWLKTIVDQNTHTVVTNTYGNDGRVIEQLDARGKKSTFDWNAATRTSTMTDARQNVWKDVYTKYALTKRINPLGNTTEYGYDGQYNLTSVKDPRGNTTTMTYDPRGDMLSRTPPAALGYQAETWTYIPGTSDVNVYTDRKGNTTDFDYDPAGNLTAVTQPGAIITQFETYPGTGLVKSITDPRLKKTSFDYDAAGNLKKITTPLGNVTTMDYDSSGRMISLVEPRGNVEGGDPAQYRWTYTFDNADQMLTQTDPLGNRTTWTYDAAGNLQSRKDAKLRTTSYGYDAANNLTSVTAPDTTIVTTYEYDDVGNLTKRLDAKNHVTQYGYDPAARLTSVLLSPAQQLWTYQYDAAGNLTKMVDATGNATPTAGDGTTTYGFDALNRLASINYSDNTPDVTYAYDANSNRTSMTDGSGTESYTYDSLDRLKSVIRSRKSFAYNYDPASNVTKRTYPDGAVVDYTYDDDERLASVTSATATTSYGYDEAGNLIRTTLPSANGYVESRTYDRAGRLTEVKNEKGGNILSRFTYTLDEVGNPTAVVTNDGTITYTYDALDRLTEACFAPSCPGASDPYIRYDYDAVGDRKTETRPTGTTTYTYNDSDQLTSQSGPGGTMSYTYDGNGNLKSAGNRSFTYDLANRLATTTAAGTTIKYTYDGDGKRLEASSGTQASSTTKYLWDPNASLPLLVREADGRDALLRRYIYGADLVSMTTGAGNFYYHQDGLGSVTNLTSGGGTPQWAYSYEPFGSIRSEARNDPSAPPNVMRFTGALLDSATGLYHLRARQYDPSVGRFLTLDPLPSAITDPCVASYVYAKNRPNAFIDPSGLAAETVYSGGNALLLPSCDAITYVGNAGYIAVQTVPQGIPGWRVPDAGGYVTWGIYMYNPIENFGHWNVSVTVNGKQVDYKNQFYPPHGSLPPKLAPSGSVLSIQARVDFLWGSAVNVPNACVIP